MNQVAKSIRLLRKEKGITQDDLAEKLHVTRQTVSNYETGKSMPDIELLAQIAEVLETDVNTLIYGSVKKEPADLCFSIKKLAKALVPLCFWLAVFYLLIPVMRQYAAVTFFVQINWVYYFFLRPAFQIYLGWSLAGIAACFLPQMKPIRSRFLLILPFAVFLWFLNLALLMFSSFIGTINYHSPIPWAWLEYLSSSSWISVLCGFALWIFRIPNIPVPEKYIDTLQFACHTLIYGLFLWYSYPMFAYFRETGRGLYPYSIFFTLLLPALMLRLGWLVMKLLHLTECKLPPLKPKISLISKCIILTAIVLLLCNGFALAGHFIIQAGNLIPSGGSLPVIDRTTIQLYMLTVPKAYHYLIPYITLMKFPVYLFYAIAGCFLGWPVERITE